jgi:hypothetical protein
LFGAWTDFVQTPNVMAKKLFFSSLFCSLMDQQALLEVNEYEQALLVVNEDEQTLLKMNKPGREGVRIEPGTCGHLTCALTC